MPRSSESVPLLRAERLGRSVDEAVLLEDVSFRVWPEEVFVVFGPSGSGKSTLLRLLNRLDEPISGTVYVEGTDYREIPPRELRRRLGLVPQQPALKNGTVAENVAWGPALRGECMDRRELETLLDRLGLAGFAEREASQLSGGEAQRVAIARALFNEPDVLLLDEPVSSLDREAANRVESLLQNVITEFSVTAVLVTHDAERARRLGTRGIRLEQGRVVEAESLEAVVTG